MTRELPIVSFVAPSGTGKTTFLERLIPALRARGVRVMAIKHDVHRFDVDRDGKDTARREALYQGRDLEGEKAKGRAMGGSAWKVEGLELIPRGEIDEKQEPMLDIVEGRQTCYVYCSYPMDVRHALDVARENGFLARTTLVLHERCWKAADLIAEAGVPVILDGDQVHVERDPRTGAPGRGI